MCCGSLLRIMPRRGFTQADSSSANPRQVSDTFLDSSWCPGSGSSRRQKGARAYSSLSVLRLLTEMTGPSSFNMTPVKATFITHGEAAHSESNEGLWFSVFSLSGQHDSPGDVRAPCLPGSVGHLRERWAPCRTVDRVWLYHRVWGKHPGPREPQCSPRFLPSSMQGSPSSIVLGERSWQFHGAATLPLTIYPGFWSKPQDYVLLSAWTCLAVLVPQGRDDFLCCFTPKLPTEPPTEGCFVCRCLAMVFGRQGLCVCPVAQLGTRQCRTWKGRHYWGTLLFPRVLTIYHRGFSFWLPHLVRGSLSFLLFTSTWTSNTHFTFPVLCLEM